MRRMILGAVAVVALVGLVTFAATVGLETWPDVGVSDHSAAMEGRR